MLSDIGANLRGGQGEALAGLQQQRQAQELQRQQLAQRAQIEQTITDPRELALFRAAPDVWAKTRGSQFEAANLSEGQTRFIPGAQNQYTAPKLVGDGGVYGTQTATGYSQTGQRGPGIEDMQKERDRIAKLTPEGFMPRVNEAGELVGFDVDPGYKNFALQKAASGATRVSVPITLPAQNKFAEAFATQYAGDLSKARDMAQTAQGSLQTLQQAKDMAKNMYSGFGANARLQVGRAGAMINPSIAQKVANTEGFQSVMGQQVLNIAKQLGAGTGISNADRDFAAKVAGGSIDLNENTINRLIGIQETQARRNITNFQRMGREAFQTVPSAQGLPASAFSMPGAQNPAPSPGNVIRYDANGNRM